MLKIYIITPFPDILNALFSQSMLKKAIDREKVKYIIINLPTNDSLIFIYKDKEIMIPISDDFIELFDFKNKVVIVKNSDIFINKC